MRTFKETDWALVLGASSGFGGATALELASQGMNIAGVHFDRAATMPAVEKHIAEIKSKGVQVRYFNTNATDAEKRNETLDILKKDLDAVGHKIKVLMHSLAFGTLRPYIGTSPDQMITQAQMEMTVDVMGHSLVYWTQGVFCRSLFAKEARIFTMTSSGGHIVLPNYGGVSAAKAASESHIRQLAMELGPHGITANAILAGVTDTPALKKIPGALSMLEIARKKNPRLRNTRPEDIGKAVALLSQDDAYFISGNTIRVDGGEDFVNYMGQRSPTELE
jgi:NAD(P)-dependent dehydrogenase (short-subunit alcohol dehydrogenase family)